MTRRPHRVLAALSALWFAMLMVAGPMLHECAMHDGALGGAAGAQSHSAHDGAHEQAPAEDECDHCTCLGDCAGAGMTAAGPVVERAVAQNADAAMAVAGALPPSTG